MKTITRLLIVSLLFYSVVSCEEEAPGINFTGLEEDILVLVNEHRASIGENELIVDDVIANECSAHSKNMAEGTVSFGHDGFDDRVDRIFLEIGGSSAAENVGKGFISASDAVESWLNSPGHKANIEGDFTHTGVGVWQHEGGDMYFTQIFIKK